MSRIPRGHSPAASADGVLPSYAVGYPSGAFSYHAVYEHRDEYYSTSDDFSPIPLTPQFSSGTSTEVAQVVKEDPDAVFIDVEQWLHKNDGGFLYLPKIPRHRSLTKLRRQAVTREMSWRLTEEHESIHCGYITHQAAPGSSRSHSIHCGYITHQAAPGSSRSHIIGLCPIVLGLDTPPRNEFLASASTLKNRLADLGREMPATRHRFYGWVHSLDKLWWARMTKYVLSRWSEELHACGLYAAIRSTMYGLPVSAKHFFALCELYNPDSNTFLTRHGELGLALHEMHKISGLPMEGAWGSSFYGLLNGLTSDKLPLESKSIAEFPLPYLAALPKFPHALGHPNSHRHGHSRSSSSSSFPHRRPLPLDPGSALQGLRFQPGIVGFSPRLSSMRSH
ncbi:uncharacterized protein A4U43_C07F12500 [Asparagus officinalis]|uniref:Aminotransferase-like plant mobile domain-containing protein n=1 Tax=Asparagus officinalis TaxID=4686 RepID=A0A5P1EDD5_ASPOF|nr:uncharacterized protein A4U43_C07F12500 [Asparagus officinalis]